MTDPRGSGATAPRQVTVGRLRRVGLMAVTATFLVGAGSACASPTDPELRFVDQLRNRYPELSVAAADDVQLIDAGRAICGGRDSVVVDRLAELGVDREELLQDAVLTMCPTR